MFRVVTRWTPLVRVPLSLIGHSIKAYDFTLRQPRIQVHGFAAGFPMVCTPSYGNRKHQQDGSFHELAVNEWLAIIALIIDAGRISAECLPAG